MAGFTIDKINYANNTGVSQNFRFEYKLATDPDSAYALISASSVVNTDGTLAAPLPVTGLASETVYYVRGANICESPLEYFTQALTTS